MLMLKQKQTVLGMIPPYHHIIYTIYKLQFGHCDVATYHWPNFLEDPQTVVPCTCGNQTFGMPKTSSFLKRTAGSPISENRKHLFLHQPCLRLRNASASYLGLSRNDFYDPRAQAPVSRWQATDPGCQLHLEMSVGWTWGGVTHVLWESHMI